MGQIAKVDVSKEELCAIGHKIKLTRVQKQITQTDLAAALGISKAHLSNIETGKTIVNLENLYKISKALNCKITSFLEDEKPLEQPTDNIKLEDIVKALRLIKGIE